MQITLRLTIKPRHRHPMLKPYHKAGRTPLARAFDTPSAPRKTVSNLSLKSALERVAHGTRALSSAHRVHERLTALEKSLEKFQARISDLFPSGDDLLTDDDREDAPDDDRDDAPDNDRDDGARPTRETPFARALRKKEEDLC